MNWYKKAQIIHKEAFRNPMDVAANQLSKKILNLIINLYNENRLFSQKHRESSIKIKYEGFENTLEIKIKLDTVEQYIEKPFVIEAAYSSSQPNMFDIFNNPQSKSENRAIQIQIYVATNFSPKYFNDFYMETVMTFRHELEHMMQDQYRLPLTKPKDYDISKLINEKDPVKKFEEASKYMASLFEQEPFIRGFMLSCKKQNIPIASTLKKIIHDTLFTQNKEIEKKIREQYGLQADHVEQLLNNLYVKRAKEIFPNIKNIS